MSLVGSFITITPSSLNFPPPLNKLINNSFKIQNTTDKYVIFKIKTTSPKRYCVRPGYGILSPTESMDIQIILSYTKDPKTPFAKDRFQILSLPVEKSERELTEADIKLLLANKESNPKSNEQILRCTFHSENNLESSGGSQLNSADFSSIKTPSKATKNAQEFSTPSAKLNNMNINNNNDDNKNNNDNNNNQNNNNNNQNNNNNLKEVKREGKENVLEKPRFDHSHSSDDDEKMRKLNDDLSQKLSKATKENEQLQTSIQRLQSSIQTLKKEKDRVKPAPNTSPNYLVIILVALVFFIIGFLLK